MKYINAFTMVLSLIGSFMLAMLGMEYHYLGQGLHPAIAAIGVAGLLACGFYASTLLDD